MRKLKPLFLLVIPFILTGCGTKVESSSFTSESVSAEHVHNFGEFIIDKEPSCVAVGYKHRICSECFEVEHETIPALGHDMEHFDFVDSDHQNCGHEEYYSCKRCNKIFDDENGENEINYPEIAKKEHVFDKQIQDDNYLVTEATCTEPLTYYYSCECGECGTETFTIGQALGHDYHLTEDEYYYECSRCHEKLDSGKGEYEVTQDTKHYLFLGSSICNGYHGPNDPIHSSMADMFKDDYIVVSYKIYRDGFVDKENVYMRKIENVANNEDGFGGVYRCDHESVTLNGDGTGSINGEEFNYITKGNRISLLKPVGYIYNFEASFMKGDTVYKFAADGYTLSDLYPRYQNNGNPITWRNSYVGLMEDAISQIKNAKIDRVVIQLSTNDIGQYIDENHATHLPFGDVSDSNVFDSKSFDTKTSFGAMEWLIAKAQETWGAEVYVFTCHMSTSEYSQYKQNNYDLSKVKTTYAEMYEKALQVMDKWKDHNTGLINLWANKDINVLLNSDVSRYYVDTLHLKELGYEAALYQAFRKYFDKGEF